MLYGLIDWMWGLEGKEDVSTIVKKHLDEKGYGFISDEEDDEWEMMNGNKIICYWIYNLT